MDKKISILAAIATGFRRRAVKRIEKLNTCPLASVVHCWFAPSRRRVLTTST